MRSHQALPRLAVIAALIAIPLLLEGCGHSPSPSATAVSSAIAGTIHGGQQPISGTLLQIYTAEQGTTGGTSTPLISATLTSSDGTGLMNANANAGNANNTLPTGAFTIPPGSYTCSPSSTPVYFSGSGGNPGSGVNPQSKMLAIVGTCATIGPSTQLSVNEITTVAAVAALHNYMTAYNAIGSTPANYSAMTNAFTMTASEYANIGNGSAPGPSLPSGYYASTPDLIALANSVAACVNSTGGIYNDGSACGKLFLYTKPTSGNAATDVVGALIDLLNNPSANGNVNNIFNLAVAPTAFVGAGTAAPPDWSLPIIPYPGTPTIAPNGGTYTYVQNVTLSDSDATANLYYTTDGTTPTAASTPYTGPITVAATETIKAIAIESQRLTSSVATATFTVTGITAPTVSMTPVSTMYGSTTPVTITATSTDNGSIVTFGTTSPADGSFSPTTCTIAAGSCSVSYIPSGTLPFGTYTNDLTATFSAYGTMNAASATATLTVSTAYNFSLLASFTRTTGAVQGAYPSVGNLIQASDGNFYGTALYGGANDFGVVFRITPGGTYTLLHSFSTATTDGKSPYAGLVQGTDGNFYGTTSLGGANGLGTVYKITSSGTFTLLHSFAGGATDGIGAEGGLVQGTDGSFYGTTANGGPNSAGTVFKITPGGAFTLIYSFSSATTDGSMPDASLVQGTDGSFYGTTATGGASNVGTVFKITSGGAFTLLHSFTSAGPDGRSPYAGLVQGTDGNFYGAAFAGGANTDGTLFKITSAGTFTLLHAFSAAATDGKSPYGGLVQGSDGNFYGTANQGGANGSGIAFEITSGGTFTLLHSFSTATTDGYGPAAALAQGADGNFYGTTTDGGAASDGTIFKLTPSPTLTGPVALTVPTSVPAGASFFTLGYTVANAGSDTLQACQYFTINSAGTTVATGALTGSTNYQNANLTAPATAGTYTVALTCGGMESGFATLTVTVPSTASTPTFSPGGGPYTSVQSVTLSTLSTGASIYYTTDNTTPTTSSTLYTGPITVAATETIKAIAGGTGFTTSGVGSAAYTLSGITAPTVSLSAVATTYGSTTGVAITATSNNNGSVVTFGTAGSIGGSFSPTTCTIASGTCSVSYIPSGTLVPGTYTSDLTAAFSAYGTMSAATASSTLTVGIAYTSSLLGSLTGTTGAEPGAGPYFGSVIQANDGNFYSTASGGGANNYGTIFKTSSNGTFTLLHTFTNATTDGEDPYPAAVQGTDGNFYGTTSDGGANRSGAVYKLTPSGTFTLLYSFSSAGTEGESPYGGLVQGTDGNFYGTTNSGGANDDGAVFKITPSGTYTLLHSFASTDGGYPEGSLVQGTDGNFYGMTNYDGTNGAGTVFKITSTGTLTTLHSFASSSTDGGYPDGGLIEGTDGNFYGTTEDGGNNGDGTVFKITSTGTFTLLHSFASTDGAYPQGNLVQGSDGNFYGTTYEGGANNRGTVFKITSSGTFTLVSSFSSAATDGEYPSGTLIQGADGNFYGSTYGGGSTGNGAIFKLTVSPAIAGPVTVSAPASVTHGANFTFTYSVANAGSTTLAACQYYAINSTGATITTGALTATVAAKNATLTAPATTGTYSYALTCGGMETGTTTVIVQ